MEPRANRTRNPPASLLLAAGLLVALPATVLATESRAEAPGAVAIGPSFAGAFGDGHHAVLGVDVSSALPSARVPLWLSGGVRARIGEGPIEWIPYLEAGGWLLVNVGVGVSLGLASGQAPSLRPHLFLGVPVPADDLSRDWILFVEPYYRPSFGSSGAEHEAGLLVKAACLRFSNPFR